MNKRTLVYILLGILFTIMIVASIIQFANIFGITWNDVLTIIGGGYDG